VFLVAVTVYVSLRMEFKMAVAALVALLHDLIITCGSTPWPASRSPRRP
jgi:preprotein translocase subunit SecF